MYNRLIHLILSYLFPKPKESKEDKLLLVMGEYLKLVSDVPFDKFRINFCDEKWIEIHLICESWEEANKQIRQEYIIEEDMGNMFPYKFIVTSMLSIE